MKLIKLTSEFYDDYAGCSEILCKQSRPYYCLCVSIDGLLFAIPFRHHIKHKYCFHTIGEAGIDYSKAVVITKKSYISTDNVTIDSAEYRMLKDRGTVITNGMRKYLALYKKALAYQSEPHYRKIIECSSLQYFIKKQADA